MVENPKWSKTNRNYHEKPKAELKYDILIVDKNSDMGDYDTSVSVASNRLNRSFNRSQKIDMMLDKKQRRRTDNRYKPFTLRDYTKQATEGNLYAKSGGLGPNIGDEKWMKEKLKRERMRDFSQRLETMKKENLIFSNEL